MTEIRKAEAPNLALTCSQVSARVRARHGKTAGAGTVETVATAVIIIIIRKGHSL